MPNALSLSVFAERVRSRKVINFRLAQQCEIRGYCCSVFSSSVRVRHLSLFFHRNSFFFWSIRSFILHKMRINKHNAFTKRNRIFEVELFFHCSTIWGATNFVYLFKMSRIYKMTDRNFWCFLILNLWWWPIKYSTTNR